MEFMSGLTDDQTALLGCVAALAVCGLAMTLSAFIGQADRTSRSAEPLKVADGARRASSADPARRNAA